MKLPLWLSPAVVAVAAVVVTGAWIVFGCGAEFFGHFAFVDCLFEELFDLVEFVLFFFTYKGVGHSIGFCTGGTSDPVYIILAITGDVKIDHKIDGVDIDTTAQDIGGYEQGNPSAGKGTEYRFAL